MSDLKRNFALMERLAIRAHPDTRPERLADVTLENFAIAIRDAAEKVIGDIDDEEAKKLFVTYSRSLQTAVRNLKHRSRFRKICAKTNEKCLSERQAFLARMNAIGHPILEERHGN